MKPDYRILILSAMRADAVYLRRFARWGTERDRRMAKEALQSYRHYQQQARAQGLYWPLILSVAKLSAYPRKGPAMLPSDDNPPPTP